MECGSLGVALVERDRLIVCGYFAKCSLGLRPLPEAVPASDFPMVCQRSGALGPVGYAERCFCCKLNLLRLPFAQRVCPAYQCR